MQSKLYGLFFMLISFSPHIHASDFIQTIYSNSQVWSALNQSYIDMLTYQKPSEADLAIAKELFKKLLTNKNIINNNDKIAWEKLGFSLEWINENVNDRSSLFVILREKTVTCDGFYVIDINNNSQNILEAPHRPSDLYTHEIAYRLFREGDFLALAVNTTNRKNVDLGKEKSSYYNTFTQAVAESFAAPKILQLHAFDASGLETEADVILSSTKNEVNIEYNRIADCLKDSLAGSKKYAIWQYPKDVQELGGTLNINAKNFYASNPNGLFFHIEMSKILRENLRNTPELRSIFIKCFIG